AMASTPLLPAVDWSAAWPCTYPWPPDACQGPGDGHKGSPSGVSEPPPGRFRADRARDVAAHRREGTAVGGGKRIEAGVRHRLPRDGPARACPALCAAHGPYRVDHHLAPGDGVEALDVDRHPEGGIEVRRRSRGHPGCPELRREVAGDDAR